MQSVGKIFSYNLMLWQQELEWQRQVWKIARNDNWSVHTYCTRDSSCFGDDIQDRQVECSTYSAAVSVTEVHACSLPNAVRSRDQSSPRIWHPQVKSPRILDPQEAITICWTSSNPNCKSDFRHIEGHENRWCIWSLKFVQQLTNKSDSADPSLPRKRKKPCTLKLVMGIPYKYGSKKVSTA